MGYKRLFNGGSSIAPESNSTAALSQMTPHCSSQTFSRLMQWNGIRLNTNSKHFREILGILNVLSREKRQWNQSMCFLDSAYHAIRNYTIQ